MSRSIDVLWLVEHVAREMDAACVVLSMLRGAGLDVRVKHMYYHADEILKRYDPAVVVHPFFYYAQGAVGTGQFVARWPEAAHFNMNWEQLHYKAHVRAKAPADEFARQRVLHHAWGDFSREYLMRHGVPADHVVSGGNPAYQLYHAPYKSFFTDRERLAARHGLEAGRRWLLFPENYRWAFMTDAKLDFHASMGADREELGRMREYCLGMLHEVIAWCGEFARSGGVVVFRTRPATPASVMRAFAEDVLGSIPERLRFIKDDSVREWILASDVVMSSISTSLIEASLAGKPAYMVEPEPLPTGLECDWYGHAVKVRDKAAFLQAAGAGGGDAVSDPLARWARSEMLGHGDPFPILAEAVGELVRTRRGPRRLGEIGAPVKCNRATHEADEFSDDDARERLAAWEACLG